MILGNERGERGMCLLDDEIFLKSGQSPSDIQDINQVKKHHCKQEDEDKKKRVKKFWGSDFMTEMILEFLSFIFCKFLITFVLFL